MIAAFIKAKIMPFAIVALAVGAIGVSVWLLSAGGDLVWRKVEKQNDEAEQKADLAALNVEECNARRLDGDSVRFDFATGKCERVGESR